MVKQATAVKSNSVQMFNDYYQVCERCSSTGDYDPFLPMLWYLERDMAPEEALWYSCLFIAYYNPGSAWLAFSSCKSILRMPSVWKLPMESARRSLYGGKIRGHISYLIEAARMAGGLLRFFTRGFGQDPKENWAILQNNIRQLPGCGRWVGYIFGGILRKVHGFPVCQPDMGNQGSSGPKNGLILLTGESTDAAADKLLKKTLKHITVHWWEHRHVPEPEYDYGVQESTTCDFNSMNKGRYYIGRDIDRDQYRIRRAEKATGTRLRSLWTARRLVFPPQYLGELNGWEGIDKERLKVYVQTGEVVDR